MSPEQASGDDTLDGRSDQYSLACLVYEMLAGQPPFAGGSFQSLLARQITARPDPVRARRPEVPVAVDAALARALEKDPAARFASVLEFAAALTAPAGTAPAAPARGVAIAVLPFANLSPDPDADYLSDGITDELISALTQVVGLRVASRTSAFAFKGRAEDVRAIGARLGVTAVVEGSLRLVDRRLRVTARLTSVADGRHLWSERYDRELADVLAIEEEIARTIVRTLRATLLGPVGEVVPKRYTANARAHALYLRGRFAWSTRTLDGVQQAIRLFEQAIDEDPGYALAYAGLADAYTMHLDYRGMPVAAAFERARALARRAIALDDDLAEAHTSLAWVLFIHDWEWDAALSHFERAVTLNPGYATGHQWMAFQLMVLGRPADALAAAQVAIDLDPGSAPIRRALGWLHYYARHWDEAEEQLQRALTLNPAAEESHRVLGMTRLQRGAYDEAESAFRNALALSEESAYASAGLGTCFVRTGRRDDARALLAQLERRARERYVSPVPFTMLHTALGDRDAAFAALARAHAERRGWMVYLQVEALLDPVRDDPRFAEWVAKMRLPA
jgi:serine/threonine-protein kinase